MRFFLSIGLLPFTVASALAGWRRSVVRPVMAAVVPFPGFPAGWSVPGTAAIGGAVPVAGSSFDFIFGLGSPFGLGAPAMTGPMVSVRRYAHSCMIGWRRSKKSIVTYAALRPD